MPMMKIINKKIEECHCEIANGPLFLASLLLNVDTH